MHAPTASSKPCNWSIRMPDPTTNDPLVPRHRGFDGFGMTEDGQVFGGEEHLDAARHPRLAADQAEALQREHHLVHDGGLTRKWRCMSVSAGGRPWTRV